jgi:hypothetical protein
MLEAVGCASSADTHHTMPILQWCHLYSLVHASYKKMEHEQPVMSGCHSQHVVDTAGKEASHWNRTGVVNHDMKLLNTHFN